jgi:hypothetical protein
MAKKQKISDKLQEKFNKLQFQPGAAVFFFWMGQKQYGYVTKTKQNSWGIQYTVESCEGVRYPCGIQIQNVKTDYHVGYIYYEETKSLGNEEIQRRIATIKESERISKNYRRPTITSAIDNTDSRTSNADNNGTDSKTRKTRNGVTNDVSSSSVGTNSNNSKKRTQTGKSTLEDAIQRQRDFLNGFVKRN